METFEPNRRSGTLRPQQPKRKQKLKKQPKQKKRRLRSQTAPGPLILRPRTTDRAEMPATARVRRIRRDFGGVIRSVGSLQSFVQSARMFSLILLLVCAYSLYAIATNSRFYLNTISIEGVSALASTDILKASGLQGKHMFAIEPEEAAEAINAMQGVLSAEVNVSWPDSVNVIIEEDTPVLLWNEAGQDYWVTESGSIIPAFNQNVDLLRIRAVVPQSAQPLTLSGTNETNQVKDVPTHLDFVPQEVIAGANALHELFPYVTEFEYAPSGGLRFMDERGWLAKFGTGEELIHKHSAYESIASYLEREGIVVEYINVSVVSNPVYKPINSGQ